MYSRGASVFICCALLAGTLASAQNTADKRLAAERWFLEDEPDTSQVNTGDLEFFDPAPPGGPFHHHANRLTLTADTLESGWVRLEQCHDNLDAVPRTEVVFRDGKARGLVVVESRNIGRAWVESNRVQLRDVGKQARLCIAGELRLVRSVSDGGYLLRSGPYMRRFLDGYYPMRVSLQIDLAGLPIRIDGVQPVAQPGFEVRIDEQGVGIDALFAGRLMVELKLRDRVK